MSIVGEVRKHERAMAFSTLVDEYYKPILRLSFWLAGRDGGAEDLCQQVFLKACERFDQLRDPGKAKQWLIRIALNEARSAGRRMVRSKTRCHIRAIDEGPRGEQDSPDVILAKRDRRMAVTRAVQLLPEDRRAVVVLRIMQGLPGAEVAELLRISQASVSRWMSEGLEMLRGTLLRDEAFAESELSDG